jgi:hypothetical protein
MRCTHAAHNLGTFFALSLSLSLSLLCLSPWIGMAYGLDSTSFNPASVQVTATGGVPVGTVVAWPVASNPSDASSWLECNGQSTAGYPELAAVVGPAVPDYRGLFLRGYGAQTHSQNNGSTVGVTATIHQSGPLRQIQGDAIRNVKGGHGIWSVAATPPFSYVSSGYSERIRTGARTSSGVTMDLSQSVPTAAENRPVNTAVRYLIRARP